MPRPRIRTHTLLRDDVELMKRLFGTLTNAYELLRIEDDVPMPEFRRAMAWLPVREEHAEAITARWNAWRARFLKNGTEEVDLFLPANLA